MSSFSKLFRISCIDGGFTIVSSCFSPVFSFFNYFPFCPYFLFMFNLISHSLNIFVFSLLISSLMDSQTFLFLCRSTIMSNFFNTYLNRITCLFHFKIVIILSLFVFNYFFDGFTITFLFLCRSTIVSNFLWK